MKTNRFETFFDAVIAIILTVLVLKIPQPNETSIVAFWDLRFMYFAYLISFLIIFNAWYNNHNLFKAVDNINNKSIWLFAGFTFMLTLIPFFTLYLAQNPFAVVPETCYGLVFIISHIFYYLAITTVNKDNQDNTTLQSAEISNMWVNFPLIIIILGFIITYTINPLGIIICCLISIILWTIINRDGINGI